MAPKVSSDQMHSPPTARKRNPKGFWYCLTQRPLSLETATLRSPDGAQSARTAAYVVQVGHRQCLSLQRALKQARAL